MKNEKPPVAVAAGDNHAEFFFDTFKAISYNQFKSMLDGLRERRDDLKHAKKQWELAAREVQAKAAKIRDPQKRKWLAHATSVYDVDFIARARPDFWRWLEKVQNCPHLHLDVTPQGNALDVFYNCRWCGATVTCACRYPEGRAISGASHHWARRESTSNELFREAFVRPGICYRCRGDESLAAARQYGKDRLERVLWRELLQEEIALRAGLTQPDYDDVARIIRAVALQKSKWRFPAIILARDESGVIRRALERALRIKKILGRHGKHTTIKQILVDFVKAYCHLSNSAILYDGVNNLYALESKLLDDEASPWEYENMPYTLYLGNSYESPSLWRSCDLERHPEKAVALPFAFQLALLASFIEDRPPPVLCDTRRMAKERLAPLLEGYSAERDFGWALEAVRHGDMGLFLKMLSLAWQRDRSVVESRQYELRQSLELHRMLWAVWEYDQYASGGYSGFENMVKKDEDLRKWLLSLFALPKAETFLEKGEIITNVVGMRHIPWEAYLDLDRYIGKNGFFLLREPENESDAAAIMVFLEGFGKAGYLKRALAAALASLMDRGASIGAELFARHYPYYDQDVTLYLRLKQAPVMPKSPDMTRKYRKRPRKKPQFIIGGEQTDQKRAISNARNALEEAKGRLEREVGHERIPENLRTAVMYTMESWLYGQGLQSDTGNGWHSMKAQFMEKAPDKLVWRVENAFLKVAALRGHVGGVFVRYALSDRREAGGRRWRWEVSVAIKQLDTLIRLVSENMARR
jgi:hypothetical protein